MESGLDTGSTLHRVAEEGGEEGEGGPGEVVEGKEIGLELTDDALLAIFGLLTAAELNRAAAVCTRWASVAQADVLWRAAMRRTFGQEAARQAGSLAGSLDEAPAGSAPKDDALEGKAQWKAAYHARVRDALPIQAALKDKTILMLGDPGVGKSTYVTRFKSTDQERSLRKDKRDMAFLRGTGKNTLRLPTNYGPVTVTLWDQQSTRDVGNGMRYEILDGGHAAILMFEITSRQSYKSVAGNHRDMMRVHQDPPMVLVGSKLDLYHERIVKQKQVLFHRKVGIDYHEICSLANHNIAKPLESLFKKFTGKDVKICTDDLALERPQLPYGPEYFDGLERQTSTVVSRFSSVIEAFLYAEGRGL